MIGKDFDNWLDRAVAELPREREPAQDLWPGIEARIGARRRIPPALAAAAAVAALALGVWLALPERPAPGLAVPVVKAPDTRPTALESAAAVDRAYRDALLAAAGDVGMDSLPAHARQGVRTELARIDEAQRSIHRALQSDPDSAHLVALLVRTHEKRLDLVQRLAAWPTTGGDENESYQSGARV